MTNPAALSPIGYCCDYGKWLIALLIVALLHGATLLWLRLNAPHPRIIGQPNGFISLQWVTPKTLGETPHGHHSTDHGTAVNAPQKSGQPKLQPNGKQDLRRSQPRKTQKPSAKLTTPEKTIASVAKSAILEATEQEVKPHLNAETLRQQIAQLGTEIRLSQQNPEQDRIKFIDQVGGAKFVASQYVTDLKNKVKRAAENSALKDTAKQQLSANLALDVGVMMDGSIYSIRVSKSSGNPVLDDAAKRIVKISAPFPPLPLELSKQLKVLVIPITWYFTGQSRITAR